MDKIKVKAVVEEVEAKGTQQVEQVLLDEYNEKKAIEAQEVTADNDAKLEISGGAEETQVTEDLKDADVLSYINKRYDREISSIDELVDQRKENEELPEDVASYFEYKKETGRGLRDYMKLQEEVEDIPDATLISNYWKEQKPHLDDEDIKFEFNNKFGYNQDEDQEAFIRERQIAKKEELAKARSHYKELQSKFRTPVESTAGELRGDDLEGFNAYKNNRSEREKQLKTQEERSKYFTTKTTELFNDKFEGFNFDINDTTFTYKPAETEKILEKQSDLGNFMNQHLTEEGFIQDARKYHRALSAAMNPDAFAKYFYEQGQADAVTNAAKSAKNIDMKLRNAPESKVTGGMKISSVPTSHGNGLKIRSKK